MTVFNPQDTRVLKLIIELNEGLKVFSMLKLRSSALTNSNDLDLKSWRSITQFRKENPFTCAQYATRNFEPCLDWRTMWTDTQEQKNTDVWFVRSPLYNSITSKVTWLDMIHQRWFTANFVRNNLHTKQVASDMKRYAKAIDKYCAICKTTLHTLGRYVLQILVWIFFQLEWLG